jgi:drug/metabolite transporter (DMT)-like permease
VAWLFAGEHFSGVKIVGALLTLCGVAWAQLANGPARESPAPVD